AAESVLIGSAPIPERFAEAAAAAAGSVEDLLTDHHADADMRRDLVRVMVQRALEDAVASGEGQI
ncbi:MAG: FAD binding domain-containing protein, partial [Alphaproteobacteria bacterium]